jgi:hypothetical protein
MSAQGTGAGRPEQQILRAHIEAERAIDVAATMALVSDRPYWLMHPVLEIRDRSAIEELYVRTLPAPGHAELSEETIRAVEDPEVTTWGERFCIIEYPLAPERYPLHRGLILVLGFDDRAVSSERVYLLDPSTKDTVLGFFGPDFLDLPGVRRL